MAITKKSISAILPAYNEEASLRGVVTAAFEILSHVASEFEIIIVDDGSTDHTPEIADRLAVDDRRIYAIHHKTNRGYGAALNSGFQASKHEFIFFMDSDDQFDAAEIENLLSHIEDYDIVTGYRDKRQDRWHRIAVGNIYSWLIRLSFGINIKDVDCGFKLFKRTILDKIKITTISLVNAEIFLKAKKENYRIKQVKITHFPRRMGKSKGLTPKVALTALKELLCQYIQK